MSDYLRFKITSVASRKSMGSVTPFRVLERLPADKKTELQPKISLNRRCLLVYLPV